MGKSIKMLVAILCVGTLFMMKQIPVFAVTTSISSWHLVDSGKHLDWGAAMLLIAII